MDRDSFLDYLARLVSEEFITEAEAIDLMRRFDAGEINDNHLSLPLDEAINETTEEDVNRAARLLVGFGVLSIINGTFRFHSLSDTGREKVATRLQDRFAVNVRSEAPKALTNLPLWQTFMGRTIQEHIIQQGLMGRFRPPTRTELKVLDSVIKTQQAFLSRFADEQSGRLLAGEPFSSDYIAHRSELYNGEARRVFFDAMEEDAEDGTVFDYIAVDDKGTCDPCSQAEAAGPYLPSDGPMPGEICEGRGFCRCVREARFSPEEANSLRRELRAA